jgi:hypothetical protein
MSVPQTPNRREAALAARAAGDRALALALFSAAGDPWSRVDAAAELLALGREAEAETSAEALSRERPDFAPAWRMLGLIARARRSRGGPASLPCRRRARSRRSVERL